MTTIILWLMVLTTLTGAVMAAAVRRVLYPVLWLGLSLLGLSGLFLALGSPFVAAMQMLIYIGGISVLMVFAVMLSVSMSAPRARRDRVKMSAAAAGAIAFFGVMTPVLLSAEFGGAPAYEEPAWDVSRIGHALLQQYNVPFEALSLLLSIAIIGALMIARKEKARR